MVGSSCFGSFGDWIGMAFDGTRVNVRSGLFASVLCVIAFVGDGLPKVASPLRVQMMLIPISTVFVVLCVWLLRSQVGLRGSKLFGQLGRVRLMLWLGFLLECWFVCLFLYETVHYAAFGYVLLLIPAAVLLTASLLAVGLAGVTVYQVPARATLALLLGSYAGAAILAIFSFPLNYLRSDMMPVIFWADRALLAGQNPYQTFHVADRLYDFPYLPGMLLAFAPAQALHVDLRWASVAYVVAGMALVYWAAKPEFRLATAALIGLFVLNPYLQYRHELYTQGHFFSLIVIFVLMQRGRFAWSAVAFGASMVISQFSWVLFPFFLMNGLRRGGWREVGRMALVAGAAAAALMAPFVRSGAGRIAHNAVGQWDNLGRAIARPINLAYWASYVVKPSHLKWIQLVLLTGIFCYCWARGRCADLEDTLRWMIAALTVFILLNVLLDGYFYLMLLVPMLVYTCVANGWWAAPAAPDTVHA